MLAICVCSATIAGILSLFAMVSNGILLYVMYRDPLNCFRKPITVLIAALAVNDFFTGSVISAFHIVNELSCDLGRIRNPPLSGGVEDIISLFAFNNCTLLITALSGERLIAVALPFYYRATASNRKTLSCVVCIMAYSFVFCLIQLSGIPMGIYYTLQLHLNMTFPLVSAMILNFALLHLLRRYRRRACSVRSDTSDSYFAAANENRFEIDKQFALTAILIVFFLLLFHGPYYLMTIIELYCTQCTQSNWFVPCRRISILFLFINSACNPFTYTFRIRQCRRSLKALFFKWQKSVEVFPTTMQDIHPATRKEIVLQKISRMCPKSGEFLEEFKEGNCPDNFGIVTDNMGYEDFDVQVDVWDTTDKETKQEKMAKDHSLTEDADVSNDAYDGIDDQLVFDTRL